MWLDQFSQGSSTNHTHTPQGRRPGESERGSTPSAFETLKDPMPKAALGPESVSPLSPELRAGLGPDAVSEELFFFTKDTALRLLPCNSNLNGSP